MKRFIICNKELIVDNDLEKYNKYKIIFDKIANRTISLYDKGVKNNFFNIDEVINGLSNYAKQIIVDVISEDALHILFDENIKNVDVDIFLEKYYYKNIDFDQYFNPLLDRYAEIINAKNELKQYRQVQKVNRGKWEGGGFGIKGAIKGVATAGLLNMGTDALRSIGDYGRSVNDDNRINSLKESLYRDKKIFNSIKNGLYKCIIGIFYGVIEELINNEKMNVVNIDSKEAKAIFENTIKFEKNIDYIVQTTFDCIQKYPYNFDFYKILIEEDLNNNALIEMAELFGLGNEARKFAQELREEKNRYEKAYDICYTDEELSDLKYDIEKEINFLTDNGKIDLENDKIRIPMLAADYITGADGFKVDLERAFFWYKKGADFGDTLCMKEVSQCYLDGNGVEINSSKGIQYKIKLVEVNDYEEMIELSKYYLNGYYVDKDYNKAYELLNKVVAGDNDYAVKRASYYLGILYQQGKGVEKNIEVAKKYFKMAMLCFDEVECDLAKERLKECKLNSDRNSSDRELGKKIESNKEKSNKKSNILGYIILEILAIILIPWKIIKFIVVIWIGITMICEIINPKFFEDDKQ